MTVHAMAIVSTGKSCGKAFAVKFDAFRVSTIASPLLDHLLSVDHFKKFKIAQIMLIFS